MYTDKQKYEFVSLRAEGMSYEKISKKLNIPIRNLFRWGKNMSEEISELKSANLEAILDSHNASTPERIRNLAKVVENIDKKLLKEDFVYADRFALIKWKLKIHDELLKYEAHLNKSNSPIEKKKNKIDDPDQDVTTDKMPDTNSNINSDQGGLFNE
jgi:hypothetical protein